MPVKYHLRKLFITWHLARGFWCSHMSSTLHHPDRRVYVGRSYELNPAEEDLCLVTTRIEGKAMHVGFSTLFIGRLDGINDYGVVVTMSAGVTPPEREKRRGF